MAPFVERQYGADLYEIMRDDQAGLRPGRHPQPRHGPHRRRRPAPAQPQVHPDGRGGGRPLRRVRLLRAGVPEQGPHHHAPPAHRRAPRDRRGGRRAATPRSRRSCAREQEYEVVDTCAVDGMCQTACPVLINTGDLVRRLRSETVGAGRTARCGTRPARRGSPSTRDRLRRADRRVGALPAAAHHRARTALARARARRRHAPALVAGPAAGRRARRAAGSTVDRTGCRLLPGLRRHDVRARRGRRRASPSRSSRSPRRRASG